MVFSSSIFLLYFLPIFLIFYYATDRNYKNYILLLASIFFYTWGEPWFIFVILSSTFLDYHIVNGLYLAKTKRRKNIFLILSISTNLGLLLFFKYAGFFIENINVILGGLGIGEITVVKIGLPIGISFYTFQTLTYSIDIYRGIHRPLKRVSDYMMYILMFPQLVAGPIVRFNEIADQITDRSHYETIDYKLHGFFRFVIGLAKKVLIANAMGAEADRMFSLHASELTTQLAWLGILAYAFQIYFDFSGYSDMAIGIGRMIGFHFPENFNNPYVSQSITEFWRRWHMTLGRWMKDYLYIPMGGNRVKSKAMLYFNLWFVFLVSGLWHGAAWNFIIWGAYHGLFLIADRLFLLKFYKKIGQWPSILITFIITLVGWVIFRAESFTQVFEYSGKMFAFEFTASPVVFSIKFWTVLLISAVFSFLTAFPFGLNFEKRVFYTGIQRVAGVSIMSIISLILLIISVSSITTSGFNPFIYFRF
ncbi:MAG: MBOAT family protein [Bacteroidetes bacterium]|nr:MBOAT family protein [Bacteroidota bacterium]